MKIEIVAERLCAAADRAGMTIRDTARRSHLLKPFRIKTRHCSTEAIVAAEREERRWETDIARRVEELGGTVRLRHYVTPPPVITVPEPEPNSQEPTPSKPRTTTGVRKRKSIHGFPVTAVIRRLAVEGWELENVSDLLRALTIDVADSTVKIQHKAGLTGQRGLPAELTPRQLLNLEQQLPN